MLYRRRTQMRRDSRLLKRVPVVVIGSLGISGLVVVLTYASPAPQEAPGRAGAGARPQPQPQSVTQPASAATGSASSSQPSGSDASQEASSTESAKPPRVKRAYNLTHPDPKDPKHRTVGIDDIVVVEVERLEILVNIANCLNEKNEKKVDCQEQPIAFFLDGRKIEGTPIEAIDSIGGTLQFHLRRASENNEDWSDLLGDPPLDKRFFERPTVVSVGLENGSPLETTARDLNLVRVDKLWFWSGLIAMIVLLLVLIQLAVKSDIIRAAGDPPKDAQGKPLRKSFSLARFQMAFWFMLVIISFSFIWLITGALDILNTSILALIGIGSGTALGSFAVDVSKNGTAPASEGFFRDILSDSTGICFYRFQMFVWTLVLGMIFLSSVWYSLTMPEFSATLLALQGISAGTYLGFKIPEKPSTATDPRGPNGDTATEPVEDKKLAGGNQPARDAIPDRSATPVPAEG